MAIIPTTHHLFLILLTAGSVHAVNPLFNFCIDSNGNYTANSVYQTNLKSVLSDVASDTTIDYGFYNFSSGGQSPDRVNAIALCRGDVSLADCRSCLNESRYEIVQRCPQQKEAILWYDNCMLRYSNRSIFGVMETIPAFYMWNENNATSASEFGFRLRGLLDDLAFRAAAGGSTRKFAAGNAPGPDSRTLYALVQCTPDLSEPDCKNCLNGAIEDMLNVFLGEDMIHAKLGTRVVTSSCNLRFEVYRFYGPSPSPESLSLPLQPAQPPPLPPSEWSVKGKGSSSETVIIVIVPVAVVCLFVSGIYLGRKVRKSSNATAETADEITDAECPQYDFATIRTATNYFSESNKLGQGGFGSVYKGILANGQELAVKRLSRDSGQGDLEFKNEVLLVAKLQHRNLVRLLGFCLSGAERLLVYEFVPNASLDQFIFDPEKCSFLDWERRYQIIGGIARGLLYLHEDSRLRIVHRDLKASNVLLDAEMTPKIADFGMAKLFRVDQIEGETNRIVGTYGYMAPEYVMHGQFSIRSDVFSFGVLILEIITGHRNNSFQDLLSSAWRNWNQGMIIDIVHPSLRDNWNTEILRCIHIGLLCVQEVVGKRPTMPSVVMMLNSFSVALPVPSQPALCVSPNSIRENSSANTSAASKNLSTQGSENGVSITDLHPR